MHGNKRKRRNLKARLLQRQGNRCLYCGGKMRFEETMSDSPDYATIEHLVPLSQGGHPTALSNLALAHQRCNMARSDKPLPPQALANLARFRSGGAA